VPARILPRDPVEVVLTGLHESHEVSAYEAVERLVHAAEIAGLDTKALLAMLDQGIALQKLLELIISKGKCSQKAA
jgi:hypothetical protein